MNSTPTFLPANTIAEMEAKLESLTTELAQERAKNPGFEYCEECNTPLSACGELNPDGTPSMDCLVCKLRSSNAELDRKLSPTQSSLRDREHQWMFGVSVQAWLLGRMQDIHGEETMLDALRRWKRERDDLRQQLETVRKERDDALSFRDRADAERGRVFDNLSAHVAELEAALRACAETFEEYERIHRRKGVTGLLKAEANEKKAEMCRTALKTALKSEQVHPLPESVLTDEKIFVMPTRDYDHSIHSNPNARAWAAFFAKTIREIAASDAHRVSLFVDEEYMTGWFANAMCAQMDFDSKTDAPKES